ncbi:uncharacterized protein BO96DRAFT_351291 [Aspergillus niger CBS 101883]|uniref:Contig An12c0220, genomic contig n=2 Tax=Aspergillus niger TaxID=5061 RepID=A2R035_ASPNC|nr:uncharacterized protein BO96DRAFT_351291 [Aspergillus niger CBS 101883]XP_059604531.1 uncharacterized protein An12g07210 [Aspergillus niger]PYH50983.1 hypothetical protein BO96DRAFT_351291 [Aspergillus niger CBS 101883]CAK46349.1 unnamed protein product [Aspergillus niger]
MIGPLALRGHEPWGQESFHIRHVLTARYVADYDNDNPTDTRKRNIPLSSEVLDIDIMTEGILLAEAHTRARIGAILFKTLAIAEKKDGMTQEKVSSSSTQSAQSVLLQYATHMMMPSGLFNKKRDLVSGRTDYSLWSKRQGKGNEVEFTLWNTKESNVTDKMIKRYSDLAETESQARTS